MCCQNADIQLSPCCPKRSLEEAEKLAPKKRAEGELAAVESAVLTNELAMPVLLAAAELERQRGPLNHKFRRTTSWMG